MFALFLTLAVSGLGWLTRQTLQLDRAQSIARRQAEQEERAGLALWRMDAFVMRLLVQEASRPDFAYAPSYLVAKIRGGRESPERTMSPLLEAPPEFVVLHFQMAADGRINSPQVPRGEDLAWSRDQGIVDERVTVTGEALARLSRRLHYAELLAQLPELPDSMAIAAAELSPDPANFANYSHLQTTLETTDPAPQTESPELTQQASPGPSQQATGPLQQSSGPSQLVESFAQQQLNSASNAFLSNGKSPATTKVRNASTDLSGRNSVFQAYANRVSAENRMNFGNSLVVAPLALEGMSRPLWVGDQLILARRVSRGGATFVQGCWLDWPVLSARLRQEVADILPEVELMPAKVEDVARSLATIPVKLAIPPATYRPTEWTPIHLALALAWVGLLVAASAAGVTLSSVLALSERRAAFVAAVTHELRTPLTTFRIYAEMLSEGMVSAENEPVYLETLRAEAERLSHLVDNVLQYARLERGRRQAPRETLTVEALIGRVAPPLTRRADQVGLKLETAVSPEVAVVRVTTDAGAFEQILFNLVDNACKYASSGSDRRLHLEVAADGDRVVVRVRDHGPGISAAGRRRLFRPFSKTVQEAAQTAPGVGLGLALSQRLARELNGQLRLERTDASGTVFALALPARRSAATIG